MFKNILRIQVKEAFPVHVKGRPRLLGFDDAYEDILQVVRTGMQWRHLRPKRVSYITVDHSVAFGVSTMAKPSDLLRTRFPFIFKSLV